MYTFPFRPAVLVAALACAPLAFAAAPPAPGTTTGTWQSAGHHHGGHAMKNGGFHMKMFDQLNLSDTQRTSVRQLFQQHFEQARPAMEALRQKHTAFENATPGTAAYQSAADDLAQAESSAAHDRVLRQAELRTKIYNLLTPEQRTQYATLRARHETKMERRHESHMQHMQHMQKRSGVAPASTAAQ